MSHTLSSPTLDVAHLRVGHYVHLDLSWMEHPFASANFKIRDKTQLATIRSLGLQRVRWSPQLSDPQALAAASSDNAPDPEASTSEEPAAAADEALDAPEAVALAVQKKQEQAQRMAQHRAALKESQRRLGEAAHAFRNLSQQVYARPVETRELARDLVEDLASTVLGDSDVAIHLIADKAVGDNLYHHSLNVSLLTMLLAREMKLSDHEVTTVGLGALLHDLGKTDVPERVWRKPKPHTRAEQSLIETHVVKGLEIGRRMELPLDCLKIILHHHENADGSGYPKKLKGDDIPLLARLVAVVDAYDFLCNPADRGHALTPHEALALMFRKLRHLFDPNVLNTFIRSMGIYPPGTLVELSTRQVGLVVEVNSAQPLKPTVLVYDSSIPRESALLLDLSQPDMPGVVKTLRPSELSQEAHSYLAPSQSVTYYLQRKVQRAT